MKTNFIDMMRDEFEFLVCLWRERDPYKGLVQHYFDGLTRQFAVVFRLILLVLAPVIAVFTLLKVI